MFITDRKGKIIISRNYRGDLPMTMADKFSTYVQETPSEEQLPIYQADGITFYYIKYNDLYLAGIGKHNCNVALVFQFLYRMTDVFKNYFGDLNEESIRDNFVVIYELFDECGDNGYPQVRTPSPHGTPPPLPPQSLSALRLCRTSRH